MKKEIKLFNSYVSPNAIYNANGVLTSGYLNQGQYVDEFENLLSDHFGKNILTTNSCTSALHLALLVNNIGRCHEVILSPQTFVATGMVILMVGAKPVFCDVDENGNMCPDSMYDCITEHTKAIIPVHFGGVPCKLKEINSIAKKYRLAVIEDAAHALGATYHGKYIGNISDFTAFSFQAIKMLTTGDGGALSVKDKSLFNAAKLTRWFGMDKAKKRDEQNIRNIGYKYNMNDLDAAIGLGNFENFFDRLKTRQGYAEKYTNELNDVYGLKIPRIDKNVKPSYWLFTVCVKKRKDFIQKLKSYHIQASPVDRRIDKNIVFGGLTPGLHNLEKFDREQVSIPVHENLSREDIDFIIKIIRSGW